MDKVVIEVLVGLPRAGKSTYAKTCLSDGDGYAVVNPDSIRLAVHGQPFFGPAEPLVWAFANVMVKALALAGHKRILIDATNVTAKRRAVWLDFEKEGYEVEIHIFDTLPGQCIKRAEDGNRKDLIPVIVRMAQDWDLPRPPGWIESLAPRPSREST